MASCGISPKVAGACPLGRIEPPEGHMRPYWLQTAASRSLVSRRIDRKMNNLKTGVLLVALTCILVFAGDSWADSRA